MTGGAIDWLDWGEAAFRRAQDEGKLVFLDISARWCHWCHVLDGTSLADPRVRAVLAQSYVCIRVDTDRRPDVNERYNQGGWPSVAVLMPDGRLLTGATYLPPDALLAALEKCAAFYRNDRDRIDAYLAEIARKPESPSPEGEAPPGPEFAGAPDEAVYPMVRQSVLSGVDPVHAGFFREPKFLMTEALAFLRDAWCFGPDAEAGDAFLAILRRMVKSGVSDAVEGGFFRYATKRDWTVPHYEKLLSDNAGMLALCASASELSGDPLFAEAARDTLRFLLLTLYDRETGAFSASQDADETYYSLDGEGRSLKTPPTVDRTVISEYNAAAVSALVVAARAFPDGGDGQPGDGLLQRAIALGRRLSDPMWAVDTGQVRFRDASGLHAGHLADNVSAAHAFLDLWEATSEPEWLARAGERLDWTIGRLFDPRAGLFADRVARPEDAGLLKDARHPFQANASAASALIRCGRAALRADLFSAGRTLLARLSGEFDERMGPFSAPYGSALLRYWRGNAGKACLPGDPACS
jgi:uncharacterized protein YyaL (SSP411 family)